MWSAAVPRCEGTHTHKHMFLCIHNHTHMYVYIYIYIYVHIYIYIILVHIGLQLIQSNLQTDIFHIYIQIIIHGPTSWQCNGKVNTFMPASHNSYMNKYN